MSVFLCKELTLCFLDKVSVGEVGEVLLVGGFVGGFERPKVALKQYVDALHGVVVTESRASSSAGKVGVPSREGDAVPLHRFACVCGVAPFDSLVYLSEQDVFVNGLVSGKESGECGEGVFVDYARVGGSVECYPVNEVVCTGCLKGVSGREAF